MAFPEDQVKRFDRAQHRFRPIAFFIAVLKKYADDRGPNMGALLAYHSFVAVTPLLLIFFTALSFVLRDNPGTAAQHRALGPVRLPGTRRQPRLAPPPRQCAPGGRGRPDRPVGSVGHLPQLPELDVRHLEHTVPGASRLPSSAHSGGCGSCPCSASGWSGTAAINGVETALQLTSLQAWLLFAPTAGVTILLIILAYGVLTPGHRRWRDHLVGAVIAGIGYQLLQTLGVRLVTHEAKKAGEFYQTFGVVVGFLAFAYIAGQLIILCAELNVVLAQHLWPRNLWQPPLTDADRRQLVQLALREERVRNQIVHVEFLSETPDVVGDYDDRARGGTVDTAGLNPAAHGHEGSNPSAPTRSFWQWKSRSGRCREERRISITRKQPAGFRKTIGQ